MPGAQGAWQARTPQAAARPALQACRLLASVHLVASTFLPHYDHLFPDQTPPLPGSLPDSSQAEVFTLPWATWTLCHPELGHLPALSEPLWRGRGEARSGPLLGSAQSPAHRWRSVSGCILCACLRAGPQWRVAVPWDWPGVRQLEPHLSACGVPGRVCALTGVLLGAQPRPPLIPRGPRCSPGIPARGGAPRAHVSPRPGPARQLPSPQGRHLCCGGRMPCKQSAAAGNSRLGGLALCLTRTGTPHYVTLDKAPHPCPGHSGHSLVVSSPPMSLGSLRCPPGPHDTARSCPEPGSLGPIWSSKGMVSSEGAHSEGLVEGAVRRPHGQDLMRSPGCRGQDGQTSPVPALGPERATDCCGVPQGRHTEEGSGRPVPRGRAAWPTETAPAPPLLAWHRRGSHHLHAQASVSERVSGSALDAGAGQAQEEGQAETPAGKGGWKARRPEGGSAVPEGSTPTVDRGWGWAQGPPRGQLCTRLPDGVLSSKPCSGSQGHLGSRQPWCQLEAGVQASAETLKSLVFVNMLTSLPPDSGPQLGD